MRALSAFHTRHSLAISSDGAAGARDWLAARLREYSADCGGCLEVELDRWVEPPSTHVPMALELTNVMAWLRGSDPQQASRVLVIGGHYDSRCSGYLDAACRAPGANDNASGTAVVLEAARVLSRARPKATILFAAFAGEEQGLLGGSRLAKRARAEGWNVEAVLNNDIVGGARTEERDPGAVRVFSEGVPAAAAEDERRSILARGAENDSPSRQLARFAAEVAEAQGGLKARLIARADRFLRGGDHLAFNAAGYAAIRFTELREDFRRQHQDVREGYGDLPEFVDPAYMASVARLNVAVLQALADAPAPPARARISTSRLENDSRLAWEASPGAAGYEIVWRDTTAANWERSLAVGSTTSARVPVSKDNAQLGVRALSANGRRGLVSVPAPDRTF